MLVIEVKKARIERTYDREKGKRHRNKITGTVPSSHQHDLAFLWRAASTPNNTDELTYHKGK